MKKQQKQPIQKVSLEKQSRSPLRPAIEKRLNERSRAFFNLSIKFSELIGNRESSLRLRQIEQTCVVFIGSVGYQKQNTKHQMSAKDFCCYGISKRGEASLLFSNCHDDKIFGGHLHFDVKYWVFSHRLIQ